MDNLFYFILFLLLFGNNINLLGKMCGVCAFGSHWINNKNNSNLKLFLHTIAQHTNTQHYRFNSTLLFRIFFSTLIHVLVSSLTLLANVHMRICFVIIFFLLFSSTVSRCCCNGFWAAWLFLYLMCSIQMNVFLSLFFIFFLYFFFLFLRCVWWA